MVFLGSGRRGQGNGVWPPGRGKTGSKVGRLQPAPFALAALLRRRLLCCVQAGLLRRRASAEALETVPPRPGSALKDKTGRRMLYGNPSFRFAQIVSRPCPCPARAAHRVRPQSLRFAAEQEEREKAKGRRKNDYTGSLRGGLPHGFGTKIYTVDRTWEGPRMFSSLRGFLRSFGESTCI